jgi:hypothetical protein
MTVVGALQLRRASVAAVLLVEVVLTYVRLLDKYYILSHLRSVLFQQTNGDIPHLVQNAPKERLHLLETD